MRDDIFSLIWEASAESDTQSGYEELVTLTQKLVNTYESQGRIVEDPLLPSRNRILSLPLDEVGDIVRGKICLVTGGLGCVGSKLVRELLVFQPKRIVICDIRSENDSFFPIPKDDRIQLETCSILDQEGLMEVFDRYSPQLVFHTAAQRNPGLAEKKISNTLDLNIKGTWNLLNVCETSVSVERVVFSSTGKASRYYTEEVYSASKKVCEMLMDYFSRRNPEKLFAMVRFTHIVDNSLMNDELRRCAYESDRINIHSPGKFVTAQNVEEAAFLMLNGLVYSESGQCNFLLVKNLEWPVESLEVALYHIKMSGRRIPIVFVGNPLGYGEKFFRGQLDWSQSLELNLLINVYENRVRKINSSKDIIISTLIPYDESELIDFVNRLDPQLCEVEAKNLLIASMRKIFAYSLSKVDPGITYEILKWGISPKFLAADNIKVSDFGVMVPLMIESLNGTERIDELMMHLEGEN
ncbi:MAG: polysaccharide biosynthesis protein [Lunatimonas sp.]|uniref:polysaccharide biosynthesis protein n=1 Tax=Lunatimonas sp. TaxID=2060141 RepID=UPI00263B0845|nr:polysaccharide biosynthesis protein [Lunatimonas sp.]MCC5937646.1 polysaccharide biosynthesis protein [Lunatimonas sp.]